MQETLEIAGRKVRRNLMEGKGKEYDVRMINKCIYMLFIAGLRAKWDKWEGRSKMMADIKIRIMVTANDKVWDIVGVREKRSITLHHQTCIILKYLSIF